MIDETADKNRRVDALTDRAPPLVEFPIGSEEDLKALRRVWSRMDSIPKMLDGRMQGADHGWQGLDVRTLLRGEESSGRFSAHDIVLAPGAGLPAHYLQRGAVYWVVVEGEVDLRIGAVTERVGSFGFGFAPALTRQAVINPTTHPARLYVCYSPAGAERAFAEAHEHWAKSGDQSNAPYLAILSRYDFCFDTNTILSNDACTNSVMPRIEANIQTFDDFADLRTAWMRRGSRPKLMTTPPDKDDITLPGVSSRVLLSGDEAGGAAVVFLGCLEASYGAPPHHQPSEEEVFYVLEGELKLTCGSTTRVVGAGGFGFAPRNATHGFVNERGKVARTITINSPAGHERGFEMIMRELQSERLGELLVAHGWRVHSDDSALY